MSVTFTVDQYWTIPGYVKLDPPDAYASDAEWDDYFEKPEDHLELNVTHENGRALLQSLGIKFQDGIVDSINAEKLLSILDNLNLSSISEFTSSNKVEKNRITTITQGRTQRQMQNYYTVLRKIAEEARKWERKVVWS